MVPPVALLPYLALVALSGSGSAGAVPFSAFTKSCQRALPEPLTRFYGSRPHPALSMIADDVLWAHDDPNLAILPRWQPPGNMTAPFVDTHVAVRFLGGVSNFSLATSPDCTDGLDHSQPSSGVDRTGVWCDLVVRQPDGSLRNRFDLVNSRLDRFVTNGIDLMIVLGDVPWAFVNVTEEQCENYGCQYLPPNSCSEFAEWVGTLAEHMTKSWGADYSSRIRWRLGTEANGPRWSDHGKYLSQYIECYKLTMERIKQLIPGAQVGASNMMEVVGRSGNLSAGGSDDFQWKFFNAIGEDPKAPLDWVSISHYGGGRGNFPGADYVQRTPAGSEGALELQAMRALAQRPDASLEIMEWSILNNELGQPTWEPSSVGTAWTAASATTWICHGVDRIFHWETGTTLRNSSGNGRNVNFYEQWPWNMAMLELFLGGKAQFTTYDLAPEPGCSVFGLNNTISTIESDKPEEYLIMISALACNRSTALSTTVKWSTVSPALHSGDLVIEQYRMDSSVSVTEQIVRDLQHKPGTLIHNDSLPYDYGRLLTPAGVKYAESNLERYWKMHAASFQPATFGGTWARKDGKVEFTVDVSAASVTVLRARVK